MGKFDRRVYVIYTGGTIGMLPQHNGMARLRRATWWTKWHRCQR